MTWQCMRTGECCETVKLVTMTHAERREVQAAADRLGVGSGLQWRAGKRPSFTNLVAGPCPFLAKENGLASCRIRDVRPFNCRRFMCGRFDTSERHDQDVVSGIPMRVLKSETLKADYIENQRAAQSWADAHGWRA